MKRFWRMVIAIAMAFLVVGCGAENAPENNTTTTGRDCKTVMYGAAMVGKVMVPLYRTECSEKPA